MFGFAKKKVSFTGDLTHLISKHNDLFYVKGQTVEVPKGYEVILINKKGQIQSVKNAYEFKLNSSIKYVYYAKSDKIVIRGKWGTSQRVTIKDQNNNPISIGSHGEFEYRLINPIRFINTRMNHDKFVDEKSTNEVVLSRVTEIFYKVISEIKTINSEKISDSTLDIKQKIKRELSSKLIDIGIELTNLTVENLNIRLSNQEGK
jgi:membrane protease subunit (stomatin/prohibitin family)